MTAKQKIMQNPDSDRAQTVEAKPASIRFLHAEKARVNRASLASRDVTLRQVL